MRGTKLSGGWDDETGPGSICLAGYDAYQSGELLGVVVVMSRVVVVVLMSRVVNY